MAVDILIDRLTDCLIERNTGEQKNTEYRLRTTSIKKLEFKNWKFDWSRTEKNGYHIYELFIKGDDIVQGRISLRVDGGVVDVEIVETAPHNYGHLGKYEGVGAHLFAIACQVSMESGCDGYVAFESKTGLFEHYTQTLGAKRTMGQRMVIDGRAAKLLIDKYIRT